MSTHAFQPPQRNVFFSYDNDFEPIPIAPVRTIAITDEIRRQDEQAQASREHVSEWRKRFEAQKLEAKARPVAPKQTREKKTRCRKPSATPRPRHAIDLKCAGEGCSTLVGYRCRTGMCRTCQSKHNPNKGRWTQSECSKCHAWISKGAIYKDVCKRCRPRKEDGAKCGKCGGYICYTAKNQDACKRCTRPAPVRRPCQGCAKPLDPRNRFGHCMPCRKVRRAKAMGKLFT